MKLSMLSAAMVGVASAQFLTAQPYWNTGRVNTPYYSVAAPMAPRAAAPAAPRPRPVKEPKRISQAKTLAVIDQFLTIKSLTDGTNPLTAPQFVYNGVGMVPAGSSSNVLQMMMLSQGLGGTGANNQLAYSLLNKGLRTNKYTQQDGAMADVGGTQIAGYTLSDPRQDEAINAMLWAGLGNNGLSAGEMLPIALSPLGYDAGTFDALMAFGSAFGGAW